MTQQKTGAALQIPITTALAEAVNATTPTDAMVFLLNEHGRAFTPKAFGKWFTKQCERIGLRGLSPHGLRKAACRRLAEAGCSANEIAAISGHAHGLCAARSTLINGISRGASFAAFRPRGLSTLWPPRCMIAFALNSIPDAVSPLKRSARYRAAARRRSCPGHARGSCGIAVVLGNRVYQALISRETCSNSA
jgi:hypothetical protein